MEKQRLFKSGYGDGKQEKGLGKEMLVEASGWAQRVAAEPEELSSIHRTHVIGERVNYC